MAATTTETIRLIACPACKGHVIAKLTYSVKLNERARAEGEPITPIDKTATATLTLTGVRINHECPPPKPLSLSNPLTRGGDITTHNPVTRED